MASAKKKGPLTPRRRQQDGAFVRRGDEDVATQLEPHVHLLRNGVRCDTEKRGHATPQGRSPLEIVLDASEGFIPLWARNSTLRWRFRESSLQYFEDPTAARKEIERLLGEAILQWGDAAPVKFAQRDDNWDFEVIVRQNDDCDVSGCVLASAFFPDSGRHELVIYPKMFEQSRDEQVETLIHEIGHVFGLRHFFALLTETAWPAVVFGKHDKFSIMNYGADSRLTKADKSDLKALYTQAWSGRLTAINGTPIRFVQPFHTSGAITGAILPQPVAAVLVADGLRTALDGERLQSSDTAGVGGTTA